MSGDLVLSKIDGARKLLSEAKTIQEAKHIADIAEAARVYAKRVESSIETVNYAAEVKVRAERLLGEMLQQTPKNVGAKGSVVTGNVREPVTDPTPTLSDIGVSKRLSARSQQLAALPAEKFEEAIQVQKEMKKEISTPATVALVRPKRIYVPPLRITEADMHWVRAKVYLDKILPRDLDRVKVLNEIINYCQKRLKDNL